tara:strand:- start:369 stop:1082 length:714 start_codon:yes stop_codon:yes gene_type:complete
MLSDFASELYDRTLIQLEDCDLPGRRMLNREDTAEDFFAWMCPIISERKSLEFMLRRIRNDCQMSLMQATLPQIVYGGAGFRTLAHIRIMQGRFDAILSADFSQHASLTQIYEACSSRPERAATIRNALSHWENKRLVTSCDHVDDARLKLLVPSQVLILDYIVTKVSAWVHRIAVSENNGLGHIDAPLKKWLIHGVGFDPALFQFASDASRQEFPAVSCGKVTKTVNDISNINNAA